MGGAGRGGRAGAGRAGRGGDNWPPVSHSLPRHGTCVALDVAAASSPRARRAEQRLPAPCRLAPEKTPVAVQPHRSHPAWSKLAGRPLPKLRASHSATSVGGARQPNRVGDEFQRRERVDEWATWPHSCGCGDRRLQCTASAAARQPHHTRSCTCAWLPTPPTCRHHP